MSRPSLFEEDADLGLERFEPKSGPELPNVSPDTVRKLADAGGFPSRAPAQLPQRREPLTYRSGRTASFSVKTMPDTLETFYAIARAQGWKAGETFERAVEALEKALRS